MLFDPGFHSEHAGMKRDDEEKWNDLESRISTVKKLINIINCMRLKKSEPSHVLSTMHEAEKPKTSLQHNQSWSNVSNCWFSQLHDHECFELFSAHHVCDAFIAACQLFSFHDLPQAQPCESPWRLNSQPCGSLSQPCSFSSPAHS